MNRRPEYELTPLRAVESDSSSEEGTLPPIAALPTETSDEAVEEATEGHLSTDTSRRRRFSISSQLDKSHYAVLPHLFSVEDWPEEDVKLLNDHVRHQLHSRRAKFKRSMRGFGKYVRKRIFLATLTARRWLTVCSPRFRCNTLCNAHHYIWLGLGTVHHR